MESLTYRIKMRELPVEMRPRERLISEGVENLTTPELLAILLRTGSNEVSAIDLASYLLAKSGGIKGLFESTANELCEIKGIGPAKAAQIKAALEIGRRLSTEPLERKIIIKNPSDVHNLLRDKMRYYDREYFKAVFLNTKHHVISVEIISIGSLDASLVHPRELFKSSIKKSAAAVILVHNHPSGDPTPSKEDVEVTQRMVEAGEIIGIQVLDHLVIGQDTFVSLKERGLL